MEIGDIPQSEAKAYCQVELSGLGREALSEAEWETVYKV